MDLLAMVMEARRRKQPPQAPPDNVITDEPTEDEELTDYGAEDEEPADATPDDVDYGDQGDVISDEPAEDEQGNDYGADEEGGEELPPEDAQIAPPPEQQQAPADAGGGGNVISDQGGNDQQQAPDAGGTDYGEGAPDGSGDQAQQDAPPPEGEAGQDQQQPPAEGAEGEEGQQPQEGEAPPEEGGENAEADGPAVDETQEKNEARTIADNILLLRAFNRLHADIRKFSKRVTEAKHQSILASVTYKQVTSNLDELREMVYKYILLSFDSSSYDENLYHYNNFIEIMDWNLAMIEKVNEIVAKVEDKKKDKKQ